jgi:hypothetical protein
MPCPECGASLAREAAGTHVCDGERMLDFRLFQLRGEIAAFDAQLSAWLASAYGCFAAWIAERDRRAGLAGPPA